MDWEEEDCWLEVEEDPDPGRMTVKPDDWGLDEEENPEEEAPGEDSEEKDELPDEAPEEDWEEKVELPNEAPAEDPVEAPDEPVDSLI